MNLQLSDRRQDLPVRLGSHGYRLDGDFAWLNAELHVPPYCSGSDFALELWACPAAHGGGELRGVKVAAIALDLPTPIGNHVQRVEDRATALAPLGSGEHAMVLVLVANSGDARRIHDFANYRSLQHFANPRFEGAVGYAIEGEQASLSASSVVNPRSEGNTSGTLALELWALSEPYTGGAPSGQRLAAVELGSIFGQYHLPGVERRSAFALPAPGRWHVALLLREWTLASGYVTRDHRSFDVMYEQPGSQREPPAEGARAAANAHTAATDRLRLIKPASDAASDSSGAPAPHAISTGPAAATAPTASMGNKASVSAPAWVAVKASAPVMSAARSPAPIASAAVSVAAPTAVAGRASAAAAAPAARALASAATPEAATPAAATPVAATAAEASAPAAATAGTTTPVAAIAAKASAPAAVIRGAATPTAPSAPAKSAVLNVHTASLEELSKLPGLSLKVAKAIIKARPFASFESLGEVRGIGDKTLRRIRNLISL